MEYKQSLARRIVIAFMLMTVAVGGLFSAGIVGVVHIIEERLISRDLGGELERILRDDLAQGRNPVLDPGMRFFISDGQGSYAMPPALDQLDVGFHEVFEGDLSFHALVRDIDGRRFVLLQDQSDFEAREQVLYPRRCATWCKPSCCWRVRRRARKAWRPTVAWRASPTTWSRSGANRSRRED